MSNPSGSLIGPVPGFQQQGQIDWVEMSNSLCSTSLKILQRCADAGIQPMTQHAGVAISAQFRLSERGGQRVRDALGRLRPYYGFESVLWFGFGHRSFLTVLTERELGLNCAALCACLGETYGPTRAAHLLQALWRTNDFPNDLEPSRSQFSALVSSCSGLFLLTPFPDILRRMGGPHPTSHCIGRGLNPSASMELAKAINALFQISRGALEAVEIHGGQDIAFIGAIAYWLFDLSIWVQMDDDSLLFNNCSCPEKAVVRLHYKDVARPQDSLIQISATTFVLRSIEDFITEDPCPPIIYRLKWETVLDELFRAEVMEILSQAALLGKALGAVARIYEAIATCEVDVGGFSRTHFINFQPQGYGHCFINSICALLPELGSSGDFQEGTKHSLSQSVSENVTAVLALIDQLTAHCPCYTCAKKSAKSYRHDRCNVAKPKKPYRKDRCIVAVVLLLRYLGDIMAHVECDPSMTPTLGGLERAYSTQLDLWKRTERAQRVHGGSYLGIIIGIPHASESLEDIKTFHPRGMLFLLDYILEEVCQLFMGDSCPSDFRMRHKDTGGRHCTAFSRAGVCIWLDALRSANDDPASMSTVHVVPGQIMRKGTSYTSVWDYSHPSADFNTNVPRVDFRTPETIRDLPDQVCSPDTRLQAIAKESEDGGTIAFAYQVTSPYPRCLLQPGVLTEDLLVSTARMPCSRTTTCSNDPSIPFYLRRAGWGFKNIPNDMRKDNIRFRDDGAFLLWKISNPIGRLLAIKGCRAGSRCTIRETRASSLVLIRSGQCMACLARYWKDSKDQLTWEQSLYMEPGYTGAIDCLLPFFIHII